MTLDWTFRCHSSVARHVNLPRAVHRVRHVLGLSKLLNRLKAIPPVINTIDFTLQNDILRPWLATLMAEVWGVRKDSLSGIECNFENNKKNNNNIAFLQE